MDAQQLAIEFELRAGSLAPVRARLTRRSERWIAEVLGEVTSVAVGRSARQALTIALAAFGDHEARRLLADLGLLEPSLAVLAGDREALAG
jgi:hypothetical protein